MFRLTSRNVLYRHGERSGPIPAALRDQLEIIEVSGYTAEEKLEIAQRHLLPKALSEHGITDDACQVGNDALTSIIRSYTERQVFVI